MISRHRQMFVSPVTAVLVAVACTCAHVQFDKPFVIIDIGTPPGMDATITDELTVTDINSSGAIVGYFPKSALIWHGFMWYDGKWTVFNFDDPIGSPLNSAIMGINDNFELIGWHGTKNGVRDCVILLDDGNGGYDRTDISNAVGVNISNNNECVGNQAVGAGTGWVCGSVPGQDLPPLDPAPEGWATDIGSGSIPHITGFSNNKPVLWKVVSGVAEDPVNLFGGTNWTGRATASADLTTGNEATMVGYRDDSGLSGYIWTPDGAGSWVRTQMTNLDMPFDVNNSDEAVGQGPGGQWDSRLYIADEDLTLDLRNLVQTWFRDENQVDSTQFEVTAINDSGTIAGIGKIVSDSSHVVCLLVPYDCNNNGTPDYREVLENGEDPLGNGDWLLDDCEMLRPGLQAPGAANPGNEARHVKYVNVVRFITSTGQIEDLLCDAVQCQNKVDDWDRWGHNSEITVGESPESYSDRQKEIVVTIRSANHTSDPYDTLPANPTVEAQRLSDIEEYCRRFARCIDYIQIGNEPFSGGGEYYFPVNEELPCPGGDYDGPLQLVPGDCLDEACTAIIDWAYLEAEAVLRGSALGGRPLQIIAPGTAYEAADFARNGDALDENNREPGVDLENRAAFGVLCINDFANDINAPSDFHFHFADFFEAEDIAADMANPDPSTGITIPEFVTCLEYGPTPSRQDWWEHALRDGDGKTGTFFDGTTGNLPANIAEWDNTSALSGDEWITVWMDPANPDNHGDPNADLPQDTDSPPRTPFLQTGFATMNSLGYRTVCYGPFRQEGATPQRFWIGAMYASGLKGETSPDYTRFREQYEDAAMQYSNALNPWLPHPDECGANCSDCQ